MPTLHKFPSIEQYRNVIHHVKQKARYLGKDSEGNAMYDATKPLPVLDFVGTVKLHGTNAAVCQSADGQRWFQSRERILTPGDDHYGFAAWATANKDHFDKQFSQITFEDTCILYGEWCGQGIQSGLGVSQLPKRFVPFAVRSILNGDTFWLTPDEVCSVVDSSIFQYKCFNITIDFTNPELAQNKLIELTQAVEAKCPYAEEHDVEGVGEGIVWRCVTKGWESSDMWFKVKGEKHSASKVKTLAAVDIEKVNSIKECADKIVTEPRLQQGISHLKEMNLDVDIKNMGAFLKWLATDAIKEEIDTITGSGLEPKDVGKEITTKGRIWFMQHLNVMYELTHL